MINKITGPLDYFDIKEREREKKRLKKLAKIKRLLEEFLKETPEIERLYLVGSLVREGAFYDFSDIDIAISIRPEEKFWEIYGKLEELLQEEIHLINWESLSEESKSFLEEYGIRLK